MATDILKEARSRLAACIDSSQAQREMMLDDIKFRAGEQWPEDVKRSREDSTKPGGARPCLVVNKLSQYIHQVINDQRQNRPSIRVRPVDDGSDVEVAEIYQGIIRHIEDRSSADIAYDWAFDCAVTAGLGFFRITTEWDDYRPMLQDISIKRITNPMAVYFDPASVEPDGCDARYCFISDTMTKDDFEAEYPKAKIESFEVDALGDEAPTWFDLGSDGVDGMRVVEYYKRVPVEDTVYLLSDGTTVYASELAGRMWPDNITVLRERKATRYEVRWYKLSGTAVLEETVIPCSYIPVIPVIGEELYVDGERILQGLVRPAKDPQRMYNYMRSAAVERIALTPKSPFIAAEGQIEGYEDVWENANAENTSVLPYRPQSIAGSQVPPPMRQPGPDISSGFVTEADRAEADIQSTLGMYGAAVGNVPDSASGKAIFLRQRESDTATFHFVDNLSRSLRHAGRIIVEMIPKIYDTPRIARVIGIDGESEPVRLSPDQPEAVREVDGIGKVYNLGVGRYDVTVSVGPSYTTKRQEAAEFMMSLVQSVPAIFPAIGDLMVKNLDVADADQVARRLKAIAPPQIQALEDGDDEPEVAMLKAQVQQVMGAAEQKIMALQARVQELEGGREIEVAKLQLQQQELALKYQQSQEANATKLAEADIRAQAQVNAQILSELAEYARAMGEVDRKLAALMTGVMYGAADDAQTTQG